MYERDKWLRKSPDYLYFSYIKKLGNLVLLPAEAERQRAEQEQQRAERLAARLRELGQDPDIL